MFDWLPWVRAKRERIRSTPLTDAQRAILREHAPFVASLSSERRQRFDGLLQLFLYDKSFEGCGGLTMHPTIEVTIAAHAVHLLLGLDVERPYPGLDVIRVYPSTYQVPEIERLGDHVIAGGASFRLGESSQRGYVVLSWDAVEGGAQRMDGHNVVLHEFAHQLDQLDGVADGAPPLKRRLYGPWARVLGASYAELQDDVSRRRRNVLDPYGATNPAEFFAVATETFFERPRALKRQEPALYAMLAAYYGQDPGALTGNDR